METYCHRCPNYRCKAFSSVHLTYQNGSSQAVLTFYATIWMQITNLVYKFCSRHFNPHICGVFMNMTMTTMKTCEVYHIFSSHHIWMKFLSKYLQTLNMRYFANLTKSFSGLMKQYSVDHQLNIGYICHLTIDNLLFFPTSFNSLMFPESSHGRILNMKLSLRKVHYVESYGIVLLR